VTEEDTRQKAKLLEIGEIFIPREVDMPCFASHSTAGPDTGHSAHAFGFGDSRVKISLTKDPDARLRLSQSGGDYVIYLDGGKFIENVKIIPLIAHAPNQAFLNLSGECRLECAFCAMPGPGGSTVGTLSTERALNIISINFRSRDFRAVALTSGIPDSVEETNKRLTEAAGAVRKLYPRIPIGIEAYFEDLDDIQELKDAGATEMKINIETWPRKRFEKACPNRSFEITLAALEKAVEIFGRGKVTSNIIIGLGESDDDIVEGIKHLTGMGVVPNLRGIRLGPSNQEKLEKAMGAMPERVSAKRLLELGRKHKNILEMNNLSTRTFETMCFTCKCCDIVPMVDV